MNTPTYILKRILSAIPLIFIVSVISFVIIRLNIVLKSVNVSLLIFPMLIIFLFLILVKINNLYIFLSFSLLSVIIFSYCLSSYTIIPFDLCIKDLQIVFIFNFIFLICFFMIYLLQSFISKSSYIPQIITITSLFVASLFLSSNFPINIPIKPISMKTGDPLADLRFNPAISSSVLKAEEERLGINKPMHIQYLLWLKGLMHGDLGVTQQNQKVILIIQKPLINTLLLSLCTLFATWLIALPLGIWAALSRNKFIDKLLEILTSSSMSTPTFVLAVLGLLFALNTQLIPIGGLTSVSFYEMNGFSKFIDIIKHLILPTTILTLVSIAGLQRQMRANLLDVLRQDYIKTAIAKGLPQNKIIYKHAVRNAINPLITILGFEFGALLSGAALTETILSYPGIGALTLEAARKQDVNLTMITLIIGAVMLIAGNLVADILLKLADPRIKFET